MHLFDSPRTTSLLLAQACLCGCIGCQPRSTPPGKLTLVASGDTAGWIVPCGCTANQSGGMLRRGTFVADKQKGGAVLYVDVGGAASGDSEYDRLKFEAILTGEQQLDVAAHNLGGAELAFGADYLADVASRTGAPLISCNARKSDGSLVTRPSIIVERAGRKFAIVGVVATEYATSEIAVDPPLDAVRAAIGQLGKYDTLVVLGYLPEGELLDLADNLPEADLVLGGPTGQSVLPTRRGPALVASATNKGKFIAVLDAPLGDAKSWDGKIVELGQDYGDAAEQKKNLDAFYAKLEREDLSPRETSFVDDLPVAPPEGFRVAGNASCQKCHQQDCELWDKSKHAHAWATLTASGAHVDSYCQQCHTTGYGLPGGFVSRSTTPGLVNVGCESCHGPSQAHVESPQIKTAYAEQSRNQCITCHDRENSPRFNYDEYWQKIVHGTQPASAQSE